MNISFNSTKQNPNSYLYSPKAYNINESTNHFLIGTVGGFGILEALDKSWLLKKTNAKINSIPKNIFIGILTGIAILLIGKFTQKFTTPMNEKAFDNLKKQEDLQNRKY